MTSRDLTVVLLVIVGVLVLLPVLGMSFWGGGMMGPGGMMGRGMMGRGMMGDWGPGAGFVGGLGGGIGLLFLLLVILGVVLIVSGLTRKDTAGDDALPLLRTRLARGEITKEQFEDLKEVLK